MELIAVLIMIAAGGAVAVFALAAAAIAKGDSRQAASASARATRDEVAASLLFYVLAAADMPAEQALRRLRREAGIGSRVVRDIDVTNWGEWYTRMATPQQCDALLDTAARLASGRSGPIPLRQYVALLDLSFALGFHSDAMARLRGKYGFDYIDHAKDGRPREADRGGRAEPRLVRDEAERVELLRVLAIEGTPTRQGIIAAYRKLAAAHHPDRFYTAPEERQSTETQRFIEITRAYEKLLAMYRD